MKLENITPVILTYNEEPNIGRVLERLTWAKEIVIVDSYSTDRTLQIVEAFPQVRVVMRSFVDHATQWEFAVRDTGITTDWILSLDADLILSEEFVREMSELTPSPDLGGYEVAIRICVFGHPLPRSIYPPRILLSRRENTSFYQDGHTQRVKISGDIRKMRQTVDHDDRKSIVHWIGAQDRYAKLEKEKLLSISKPYLTMPDHLRSRFVIAPFLVLLYCLFFKRLIFCGLPGWFYTYQRVTAEIVLALYLLENRIKEKN